MTPIPPSAEVRGLTVKQPWASAIVYGNKRTENRTWATPSDSLVTVTGRFLALHAGSGIDWHAPAHAWLAAGFTPYYPGARRSLWRDSRALPLGAIIAVVAVMDCHHADICYGRCGIWGQPGQFHWELDSIRALPTPVPAKGMLGLWKVPEDTERAVREQLGVIHVR